jgi:hypothetical protein
MSVRPGSGRTSRRARRWRWPPRRYRVRTGGAGCGPAPFLLHRCSGGGPGRGRRPVSPRRAGGRMRGTRRRRFLHRGGVFPDSGGSHPPKYCHSCPRNPGGESRLRPRRGRRRAPAGTDEPVVTATGGGRGRRSTGRDDARGSGAGRLARVGRSAERSGPGCDRPARRGRVSQLGRGTPHPRMMPAFGGHRGNGLTGGPGRLPCRPQIAPSPSAAVRSRRHQDAPPVAGKDLPLRTTSSSRSGRRPAGQGCCGCRVRCRGGAGGYCRACRCGRHRSARPGGHGRRRRSMAAAEEVVQPEPGDTYEGGAGDDIGDYVVVSAAPALHASGVLGLPVLPIRRLRARTRLTRHKGIDTAPPVLMHRAPLALRKAWPGRVPRRDAPGPSWASRRCRQPLTAAADTRSGRREASEGSGLSDWQAGW